MIDTWNNLWKRVVPKGPLETPFCPFMHVNFTQTHTHCVCTYILLFQIHLIPFWPWCIDQFIMFLSLRGSRETSSANPHHSQIFSIMTSNIYMRRYCHVILHHVCVWQHKDHPVDLIALCNLTTQISFYRYSWHLKLSQINSGELSCSCAAWVEAVEMTIRCSWCDVSYLT
jgi:hypothetical protein